MIPFQFILRLFTTIDYHGPIEYVIVAFRPRYFSPLLKYRSFFFRDKYFRRNRIKTERQFRTRQTNYPTSVAHALHNYLLSTPPTGGHPVSLVLHACRTTSDDLRRPFTAAPLRPRRPGPGPTAIPYRYPLIITTIDVQSHECLCGVCRTLTKINNFECFFETFSYAPPSTAAVPNSESQDVALYKSYMKVLASLVAFVINSITKIKKHFFERLRGN